MYPLIGFREHVENNAHFAAVRSEPFRGRAYGYLGGLPSGKAKYSRADAAEGDGGKAFAGCKAEAVRVARSQRVLRSRYECFPRAA